MKASATAANAKDCAMKASATAAAEAHDCSMKASAASAKGGACCAGKDAAATKEMCNGLGAGMLGAPGCSHHGAATAAEVKGTCDACAEMMTCANDLAANAVQTQVVPLKNGVMFVYTTDTPAHVRAAQNALARRNDRLNALTVSGDHARLCPECRSVRGAIASGKLTRETVNIEGGCLTLVTSSDPAMAAKLRSMALAAQANGRNKR